MNKHSAEDIDARAETLAVSWTRNTEQRQVFSSVCIDTLHENSSPTASCKKTKFCSEDNQLNHRSSSKVICRHNQLLQTVCLIIL